jgi:excinuclease ABC subunit B
VSLVAIFDADKEGFLRSPRSLIQTMGRAARNANGRVIMYAESVTAAMNHAMDETLRRRAIQSKYNADHGIIPQTVVRAVMNINPASGTLDYFNVPKAEKYGAPAERGERSDDDLAEQIASMRLEMFAAAENLEFEKAAKLRDELKRLESLAGGSAPPASGEATVSAFEPYASKRKKGTRGRASSGASAKAPAAASATGKPRAARKKWKP